MAGTSREGQREVEVTITVAKCDIVIKVRDFMHMQPIVYAQDYAYDSTEQVPNGVKAFLDSKHVRIFDNMREFTEWLVKYPAVVDSCWVIQ